MRVLHLLASPYFSGPAEAVLLLAKAQRDLGHEVAVAVDRKRSSKPPAEELAMPRFQQAGLLDARGLELSVKSSPAKVLRDVKRLHQSGVEVVHAHFTHDHIVARFGTPRTAALVRSIHAPRSLRWSLPRADAYTVPATALLPRLPAGRRSMVLPAIVAPEFARPADRAALRARLGIDGAPLVGMISTFQTSRHHDVGIAAFAQLVKERPGAHFVLVGDGALQPRAREQVRDAGLDPKVTFAGYRSGAEFVQWLQALDEVWVLGLGNDWSGRAAAQARACGVRVVAMDEGALADYADVVLTIATPKTVAAASRSGERRERPVPRVETVAAELLELYSACGAAR